MSKQRPSKANPRARAKLSAGDAATRRAGVVAAAAALVVLTIGVYLPAMQCDFIWDDHACVQYNEPLRSTDGLRRIWLEDRATPYQYYPMVHTTYWIEYRLWELSPTGYHVTNILLHAAGVVLFWRVLVLLGVPGAWLAAALFALHPVQVESVAWITERKNVLSGMFYFAAALAYLRFALRPPTTSGSSRAWRLYGASLVLFVCALLSKTATCTLPAALLLVLWWKRKPLGRVHLLRLTPFFALGIGLGLLSAWMEADPGHVAAVGEDWNQTLIERCLIAGRALCFYVSKLLWPVQLTFIYPRWQIDAGAWQQYLYPLAVIGVVVAFWLARRRIGSGPLVGILYFAGTLFPALGFFNVYYMQFSFVADHWQYLACAGLVTLIAAAGFRIGKRLSQRWKPLAAAVAAVLLMTLGTLTWRQQRAYENLDVLWHDTLVKNPDAWLAHNNLGARLRSQGRLDEAISHYRQAIKIKPTFADAHNNLAIVLTLQGKLDEAIRHYRLALDAKPDSARIHNNLGDALRAQNRLDEAISHFRRALEIKPTMAVTHYNLALMLQLTGPLGDALAHYQEAARLRPDWPLPLQELAWILA
ncbi:MAG: tetratricopeptide repeat protein, partial [Planctomycetes bacterium]|nr:tetratricopeptide repeat protein [Planctomycetota bacterium]